MTIDKNDIKKGAHGPFFLSEVQEKAVLVLEDGSAFKGISIGAKGCITGEVVFNTSMTGYQEILTDPSYAKQMITFTTPHIGNVGINTRDVESNKVYVKGIIIRNLSLIPSSWRAESSLSEYLKAHNIIGIAEIDTRRLTRLLRLKGAQRGCIMTGDLDEQKALKLSRDFPGLGGMDLAKLVSQPKSHSYRWTAGTWQGDTNDFTNKNPEDLAYHIVAYDFGIKQNILRILTDLSCHITVVPAQTPAQEVLALKPDGIFLSNGPGDPEPCHYAIEAIKNFLSTNVPLLGICLGHQLLGLALGAQTKKMKTGHHGANHPVQDIKTGEVFITSQNHGFVVDESTLPLQAKVRYRSLFDGSLQGIDLIDKPVFSFQGHPEASPGPHDLKSLFRRYINYVKTYAQTK